MNISDRIKYLRKERGESQEAFASKIEISRGNLSQIELGNQLPTIKILSDIARIYNVTLDWLIEGKDVPNDVHFDVHQKPNIKKPVLTYDMVQESLNVKPPGCQECLKKDKQIENLLKQVDKLTNIIDKLTDSDENSGQKRKAG
jgi:transcriptional regulator with XRE-family HTH domain